MTDNEIVLTPDFEYLFRTMLRNAVAQSRANDMFDFLEPRHEAEALRTVQRFLAPLNIAAQSMTTKEAVEQFREELNRIVQDLDRMAAAKEDRLRCEICGRPDCDINHFEDEEESTTQEDIDNV